MVNALARGCLSVLALAGAGWALSLGLQARDCEEIRVELLAAILRSEPRPSAVDRLLSDCRDPETVASVGASLRRIDPGAASRIATHALAEAPDTFAAWAAVALTERDPVRAHAAWVRAKRLNPRWSQPDPAARN